MRSWLREYAWKKDLIREDVENGLVCEGRRRKWRVLCGMVRVGSIVVCLKKSILSLRSQEREGARLGLVPEKRCS